MTNLSVKPYSYYIYIYNIIFIYIEYNYTRKEQLFLKYLKIN